MPAAEGYQTQVSLLVQTLPLVAAEGAFALKGGTAINLFIRDLPSDRDNQVFVKAMVDVARGLHKKTIAEFVEDAETLAMLQDFGVDMVQGYYLDMPMADHPRIKHRQAVTSKAKAKPPHGSNH